MMFRLDTCVLVLCLCFYVSHGQNTTPSSLWPLPSNVAPYGGGPMLVDSSNFHFTSTSSSSILNRAMARYQQILFVWTPKTRYDSPPLIVAGSQNNDDPPPFFDTEKQSSDKPLSLTSCHIDVLSDDEALTQETQEGYNLDVNPNTLTATITARSVYGAIHALETLSQLVFYDFDQQQYFVSPSNVTDSPRFAYRGLMIDVARRFYPVSTILRLLEGMAYNKMNVLHIHFSDDESWPVCSDVYPNLSSSAYSPRHRYSHDDLKTMVNFAADRGIRVVPEFDSPGHISSLRGSHPDWFASCGLMNPVADGVRKFWKDFVSEMSDIFPESIFHIGGDEANIECWAEDVSIQQYMSAHNITDTNALALEYAQYLEGTLASHGKSPQVWAPGILDRSPAPTPSFMRSVWSGYPTGDWRPDMSKYTMMGSDVILSGPWYITSDDQRLFASTLWQTFYSVDPHDFDGSDEQKSHVVGGEVVMWDDNTSADSANIVPLVFPNLSAVAEKLWGTPRDLDQSVRDRIRDHRCRMVGRGVAAKPPISINPLEEHKGYCPVEYEEGLGVVHMFVRGALDGVTI